MADWKSRWLSVYVFTLPASGHRACGKGMQLAKHVKNKTECKWKHPKLCFQWIGKGKGTCIRDDRKFYYPKLCNISKEGRKCERERCKYYQRRITIPPEKQTSAPPVLAQEVIVKPVVPQVVQTPALSQDKSLSE